MFDNYVTAKTTRRRKWMSALISTSVTLHVIVGTGLILRSFWAIEKLATPKEGVLLAVTAPPPPPPPPPAGKKKSEPKPNTIKKLLIEDTVQPIKPKEEPDVEIEIVTESDLGVEGGMEGGVGDGIAGGSLESIGKLNTAAPPPPPPPKAPPPPQIVPPKALEAQRISGNPQIQPDEMTKQQIQRSGQTQVVTTVKMCLTTGGVVESLSFLKSSGFPSYDRTIRAEMNQWRYNPFTVNGVATRACTVVTFIYRQQ